MSDQFIGVDVGGTKIAVAVLEGGELSDSRIVSTEQASQEVLVDQIASAIEGSLTPDTRAVGIGMPSVIEFATGKILASVNIPLHDIPLRALLTERMGVPVYVENDAGCAALGGGLRGRADDDRQPRDVHDRHRRRRRLGAQRQALPRRDDVGGGGRPHDHRARPDRGRHRGRRSVPAARVAGDAGLGAGAGPAGRRRPRSSTPTPTSASMRAQKGDVDGHDVVAGAEAGDEPSLYCLRVLGERLGIGIANAINTFDPLEVVIGGGVSRAGDLLLEPARDDGASATSCRGSGPNTVLRIARHGPRAGVLGAALIAAQEYAEDTGQNLQGAISGEATS